MNRVDDCLNDKIDISKNQSGYKRRGVRLLQKRNCVDRIEEDKIILDGGGEFPKKVIILEPERIREYKLIKTRNGGYLLN